MAKTVKVGFISLGCSKNLCDTEVMLHHLVTAGYELTPEESEADVVIINTCAFIESAKKESIDNIIDIAWLKKHHTLKGIVVTGCLAERYREEIIKELPEVDAVLGVGGIHKIVEAVESVMANVGKKGKSKKRYTCFDDKETVELGGERVVTTGDHMAYLKIAEGCSNRCTYCAIPSIRGKMRSRTMRDIVEEATALDAMGIKELNLIAQDTSAYGIDLYGNYCLPELIRGICDATKIPWIRLLYCYPDKITDELIAEIRDNPRVVKYIDIPIQHISDNMLTAMNRHGDSAMIRETVAKLRREVPGIVLRSTAIVGFPGETEDDFRELCEFLKEAKFERFGAFPYSREEDTAAYDFENQIDEQVKQDRYDIVMQTQLPVSESFNATRVGKTIRVMCEGFDPVAESHYGRSFAEAADIDGKIWFTTPNPQLRIAEGEMIDVKITDAMDYDLVGEAQLNFLNI
ncbi:MAG: 30S ribosomal protein S12 methylthiotransferase RimO [Clostridia bacterium]|nr:30S ribosomal protein S12 methylthiotransferase RimO [Clostridia bacterium]MBR5311904.1 30S ribosomal protein S12 methylthiotransferase RimO [Clostridia bacterium]